MINYGTEPFKVAVIEYDDSLYDMIPVPDDIFEIVNDSVDGGALVKQQIAGR